MAWLIQCSMFMLPWLEVGVPWESPCTEPSSSEPEEVSVFKKRFDLLNSAAKMILNLTVFPHIAKRFTSDQIITSQ